MADSEEDKKMITLKRKQPENNQEGIKETDVKKKRKRKFRNQSQKKVVAGDEKSIPSSSREEDWKSDLEEDFSKKRKCTAVEDKAEIKKALKKCYEIMKKQEEKLKSWKEEKEDEEGETYLEIQENLVEAWLEVLNKRMEAAYNARKGSSRKRSRRPGRIVISLLSRKFWRSEVDESSLCEQLNLMKMSDKIEKAEEKNENGIENEGPVEDLLTDFGSKLMFPDFEDSD